MLINLELNAECYRKVLITREGAVCPHRTEPVGTLLGTEEWKMTVLRGTQHSNVFMAHNPAASLPNLFWNLLRFTEQLAPIPGDIVLFKFETDVTWDAKTTQSELLNWAAQNFAHKRGYKFSP